MKRVLLHSAIALVLTANQSLAQDCVRVIGTESAGTAVTMDPAFNTLNDDAYQQNLVYNRLVQVTSDFQPIPGIAKSWSVSEDGKVWTFLLEQGVTFHDGKPLTAKDVIWSFKRLIDPAVGSPAAGLLGFLTADGIVAVDDFTVQITTAEPVAELPLLISNKYMAIVQDGATSEVLKSKAMGTGPFMQDVYDLAQDSRIFKRNPNYWRAGLPKAECIDLKVITEEVSRIAAIQSGSVDLIVQAGPATVTTLGGDARVELVVSKSAGGYINLSMQTDQPPFDDVRVRQAMKAVVDRQLVVDTVLLGNGLVGNDNPVAPTNPLAFTDQAIPRDVEKAKALLAEAGFPDGIDVDLNTAEAGPGYVLIAQIYQQMAAEAGIRVNIVNNPADTYWDAVWMKTPFFVSSWGGRSVPEALAYTFLSDAEYNEGNWKNPEYDALVLASRTEVDPVKRVEMQKRAQEILTAEGGLIIPAFLSDVAALRAGCTGFQPQPSAALFNYEDLACADRAQ